jgi:hypothetical protein
MTSHFSIWFYFKGKAYTAMVRMKAIKGSNASFVVIVYDESLYDLLPFGKLVFDLENGIELPEVINNDNTCNLILSIMESIARHLNKA